ncbi:transcriptional regulator, TetR family [Geodermatophilus obscurus]|uniref:Transcriptional regulator, TetR family n=1 Tax=Geodermatophilus obscurus TaxID=1861 RepID=A0A1M7V179_9ACTN|nr:TetR/AcrR family transcriptional regulator [Geodermatophilus obscurus]SHN89003.1 transcriptional regulator, TetR family [Geodermatophilus obscurus]
MAQDHRARQYASTHRRIYDTAMELFAEHGYEDVPIGRLAAAAGVSVQTFYAHYPGKDDLIMALPARAEIEALVATVPADRPLGARLRGAILVFVRGLTGDARSDALARWRLIATTPRLRYRAAEFERATAQLFLEALGLQRDPAATVAVTAHLSAYTQGLLRWADSGGELALEEVVQEALDTLREL